MTPAEAARPNSLKELREGWPVLLAGLLAVSIGMPTISVFTLTYFMAPWKVEFGWAREDVAIAITFLTIAFLFVGPPVGRLCDRYGVRQVACTSAALFSIGLAAMSQVNALWQLYTGYVFLAVLGAGAGHMTYLRTVATWFSAARGLAFGIVAAGSGLWIAVAPFLIAPWIVHHGWRTAWLLLAGVALLAIPVTFVFLKERPVPRPAFESNDPTGATIAEARRSPHFWLMFVGIFVMSVALAAISVQILPLVTEITGSAAAAASAASVFGLSLIASRIATGYVMDRCPGHIVAAIIFTGPCFAALSLASGWSFGPVLFGAFLGIASGAEADVVGVLITRYFGLRSFSEIFGWIFAALSVGGGFGSLFTRILKAIGAGDRGLLIAVSVAAVVAAAMYGSLGILRGQAYEIRQS